MTYYCTILFLSILVPFIFSFHPKVQFYSKFKILLSSIPLTAIPFIIWDIIFTKHGIWGFNKEFTLNFYIQGLPLEEILFFIVIPFCCLYTYHLIEKYEINFFQKNNFELFNLIFGVVLLVFSILNYNKNYTFYCFALLAILILLDCFFIKIIDYNKYYTTFILLMIPFLIVNGALTGLFLNQVVVWYNPLENLGIRILTIPIEDFFYAHLMISSNIISYHYFSKNFHK